MALMHASIGHVFLCAALLVLSCGDDGKSTSTGETSAGTGPATTTDATTAAGTTTAGTAASTTTGEPTGSASGSSSGGGSSGGLCSRWPDADGDGFGAQGTPVDVPCDSPGHADNGDDCDDDAQAIHPGADEGVADGVDQDCDATELCYVDADGDGHRPDDASTAQSPALDCSAPGVAGAAAPTDDCLDSNPDVFPGQTQFFKVDRGDGSFDYDCNGAEEKRYTEGHTCYAAQTSAACMAAKTGWQSVNPVPGCGSSEIFAMACVWSGSCNVLPENRKQTCR